MSDQMPNRTKSGTIVVAVTTIGCAGVLAASIYPGLLTDLVIVGVLLSCIVAPAFAIVGGILLLALARRGKLRSFSMATEYAPVAFLSVIATVMLLLSNVPRRLAFEASRSAFEQSVPDAPRSSYRGKSLNKRFGLYIVDEYAADPRGGVYFRVRCGADGIGPDQMSYGFAYQPNRQGTPFGAAHMKLSWLRVNWYWFRASDDWY